MKLYIVRHAESEGNAQKLHQGRNASLTQKGFQQAQVLANRFKTISIDAILSSDLKRARLTAGFIGQVVKKEITLTHLLRELKRPTEIEEKSYDDPHVQLIKQQIVQNHNDQNWHFSDEENFFDLKKRIEEFLTYLTLRKEDNVLLVTHAIVIRMIVSQIIFSKSLTPDEFLHIYKSFKVSNTGITLCQKKESKWSLITWNDYAHLGYLTKPGVE